MVDHQIFINYKIIMSKYVHVNDHWLAADFGRDPNAKVSLSSRLEDLVGGGDAAAWPNESCRGRP